MSWIGSPFSQHMVKVSLSVSSTQHAPPLVAVRPVNTALTLADRSNIRLIRMWLR
ncbi:hypothetical protein QA942_38135 [Streptomyces sp. B21-106]|uniref:hypothetical protein n=1 Tax=Streptomyces sp. B21-106 TaxID=3039418 RepID=UPI002FEEFC35